MADITIPVLESFSRISGTGLKAGDQIKLNYDVYDDSPLREIFFRFTGPTRNSYYVEARSSTDTPLDSGQASKVILDHWPDGYYTLDGIAIFEQSGERNVAVYDRDGRIGKNPTGALGSTKHDFNFSSADFIVGDVSAAHKQIKGTDGNDRLVGGSSHDQIKAGLGSDVLIGGQGNDILDGEDGVDTATWSSPRLANAVSLIANGDDTITGPDWTDTIRGTERFVFTDGEFRTDTGDVAAQVYRLYGATLGRAPDPGGLKGWAGEIESGRLTLRGGFH